jgi:hypothetical protein
MPPVIHFLVPLIVLRSTRDHPRHLPSLPVLALRRGRAQAGDIRSGKGLGDGQTDHLLTGKHLVEDSRSEGLLAKVEDGREADHHARVETITVASSLDSDHLLVDDELAAVRGL